MGKLSLAAILALFGASSLIAADAPGGAKVDLQGVVYGDFTQKKVKDADDSKNDSLLNLSVAIGYESGKIYDGLGFNLGARVNRKLNEGHTGEWAGYGYDTTNNFDSAVFHTANLTYSDDVITAVAGRQEINLEWMSDYHEAAVGILSVSDAIKVIVGYTWKYAESDYDGDAGFADVNKGAGVVDVPITFGEVTIEPWLYYIPDISNWLGGKIGFANDSFGISAAYTISQNDSDFSNEDGTVLHINANASFEGGFSVQAGYAQIDKDGGAGSLGAVGDNVNPFEDGNYFLEQDTSTIYIGVGYEQDAFSISALYGIFDTGNKGSGGEGTLNELNLIADYAFNDWFALHGVIVQSTGNKVYKDVDEYTAFRAAAIFSY
ncbi:hypothetical protein AGMMS50229_15410 [Campylobacterota bacterium]|nr:hypothetical protein AGMMS50229_15410 [Campylobacterota bacterium]